MLKQPDSMQAYMAGEVGSLNDPWTDESRLFPLNPSIDQNTVQVAGLEKIGGDLGLGLARILSGDRSNTLGSAYHRLRKLQKEKELKDFIGPDALLPEDEAVRLLKPDQDLVQPPTGPRGPGIEKRLEELRRGELLKARTELEQTTPAAFEPPIVPTSLVDDSVKHDDYTRHITLGNEDLDKIMADRLKRPELKDGMLGGIRAEGAAGDAKIPDEGNIRSLVGSMGETVQKKLAELNPKQVESISLEQLTDMANLLGEDPDRLRLNFMGGLQADLNNPGQLAAQMIAGKNLLISEIKVLDRLADEAASIPAGNVDELNAARLKFHQQAMFVAQLQADFKGTQTDIARALGALRAGNTADAKLMKRDIGSILDDIGGGQNIDETINAYRSTEDVSDRVELTRTLVHKATWGDAVYEVWINSILSGYWTHVKNISGGVAMILGDTIETFGAAAGQAVTKGMRGLDRDVTFGDVQAKMFGQLMSLQEAVTASGKAGWYREDPSFLGVGSKLDNRTMTHRVDAFSAEGMQLSGNWGHAVDAMGSLLTLGRAPLRALQAEDAFFKVVAYRGALYEEAFRVGRAQGLEGEAFSKHIADFMFAPPEEAVVRAQDHAKYVTLQSEMTGKWKTVQQGLQGRWSRWLVPFYKTPTNAILYVGERSPVAPWTNRYKAAMQAGGAEAAKAKTRFAMGSSAFTVLALAYTQDRFTGGISSDSRVRAAYLRQGIKPYSVRIGDEWVNYNVMEPVSTIIGIVADTMEIINHPDTDERTALEAVTGVAGAIGYNMTNKTFMAGIAKFMDAIRDPQRRMDSFVDSYMTSAVPGSAAFNEIRKLNDDLVRYKVNVLDKIKSRLPGLSETLQPKRDLWGRPIVEHRFRSPYKPNPVDKEIARLGLGLSKHPEHYSAEVEYAPGERDWLHERAGEMAFDFIKKYMGTDKFKKLRIASKGGDEIASEAIKLAMRKEVNEARTNAKKELLYGPKVPGGENNQWTKAQQRWSAELVEPLWAEINRVNEKKRKKQSEFDKAVSQ